MVNTRRLRRRYDRLRSAAAILELSYTDVGPYHYSCEYLRNTPDPFLDSLPDGSDYFLTPEGQQLLFHISNAGAGLRDTQVDLATLGEYLNFANRFVAELDDLAGDIQVQSDIGIG